MSRFTWQPRWHVNDAVEKVCEWTKCYFRGGDIPAMMEKQIKEFINLED